MLLHSRTGHHLEIFFSCTETKISPWIRFLVFMNSYSLGFDSFKILHTAKHLGNDGKNSWNSSSWYVVLYRYFLNFFDSEPKPLCLSFVILKGHLHPEVRVPNILSIQHPRRGPSHHLRHSSHLFSLLTLSSQVLLSTWLRRRKQGDRHTHSHRASSPLMGKNIYT